MKSVLKISALASIAIAAVFAFTTVSYSGSTDESDCGMGACPAAACKMQTTALKDGFKITMSTSEGISKAEVKDCADRYSKSLKFEYPNAKVSVKETKNGYTLTATGKDIKTVVLSKESKDQNAVAKTDSNSCTMSGKSASYSCGMLSAHHAAAMGGEGKIADKSGKSCDMGSCDKTSKTMSKDAAGGEGAVCPYSGTKSTGATCPYMNNKEKSEKSPT